MNEKTIHMEAKINELELQNNKLQSTINVLQKEVLQKTQIDNEAVAKINEYYTLYEALKESELHYRRLFESAKDGILIIDAKTGKIIDANPFINDLLEFNLKDLIGKEIWEVSLFKDITANKQKFDKLLQEKYIRYENLPLQTKTGRVLNVEFVSNVYLVNGHEIVQCNIRDITERKRTEEKAEEEIKSLNENLELKVHERTIELEAAVKEIESFSYSVSHDLRAPLRAISGYSTILHDDYMNKIDDEGKILLNSIKENSLYMSHLIDDILEFSRLGRAEIRLQKLNMKILFKNSFNKLRELEKNRTIVLLCNNLLSAKGDSTMIKLVINNLLSNAIKYTAKKEIAEIKITGVKKNNICIYKIEDNGVGFDEKYKDKLFGVFQRLHAKRDYEGTGVGLAIVQRLVRKHGGEVWAESKIDQGAKFYFSLPI